MRGIGEEIDEITGDDILVRTSTEHIIIEKKNGNKFMSVTSEKEALLVLSLVESGYKKGMDQKK